MSGSCVNLSNQCYVDTSFSYVLLRLTQRHRQLSSAPRIGFLYQDPQRDAVSVEEMEAVCRLPNLEHEGIFTHFAVSDDGKPGSGYTKEQFDNFMDCVEKLQQRGITFRYRHCANSGAVCDYPEMHLDMVRPGVIIYGLNPSGVLRNPLPLKPVMELKTIISMLKTVETNTTVSYGREFAASRKTTLATVPIGYADGYPRKLHNCADMLVNGHRARVVGRVCMDQLMLDVTDIDDVKTGMTVTVFGKDGAEMLSVDELAKLNETINYEMICIVGKRVPRVFLEDGKPVGSLNVYLSNNLRKTGAMTIAPVFFAQKKRLLCSSRFFGSEVRIPSG